MVFGLQSVMEEIEVCGQTVKPCGAREVPIIYKPVAYAADE
jgi:hypothetical protein